jgi:hypothetical protein
LSFTSSSFREARNRKSRERLERALPAIFPGVVLRRALSRPFVPPLPRIAVDGYWRAHPLRADLLARSLAARSGAPEGWRWSIAAEDMRKAAATGLPQSFRAPPAPYREKRFALGKGHCCICGQKVYRFGWHADLWGAGPNRNAEWHAACVAAWRLWNAPSDQVALLKRWQKHRCAASGKRLLRNAEVDHKLPLFKLWREHRDTPWPQLLGFWGLPNLQVINRDAHAQKCVEEAKSRRERVVQWEARERCEPRKPTVRDLLEALEAAQANHLD